MNVLEENVSSNVLGWHLKTYWGVNRVGLEPIDLRVNFQDLLAEGMMDESEGLQNSPRYGKK